MPEPVSTSLLAKAVEWTVGILMSVIGFFSIYVFRKLNNTYSKMEVENLIELKVSPLVKILENNSSQIEKQTIAMEKLTGTIQELHTSLAVAKSRLGYVEDKQDEQAYQQRRRKDDV